jgi:hypothetical protein
MARALMYTKRSCCPRIAGTEVLFTTCFANLPSCEVELNRAGIWKNEVGDRFFLINKA